MSTSQKRAAFFIIFLMIMPILFGMACDNSGGGDSISRKVDRAAGDLVDGIQEGAGQAGDMLGCMAGGSGALACGDEYSRGH